MSPPMIPFTVYQDENVRVTATLVSHPEVFPAFAFRFDTANGSVVFSGDTAKSLNLVRLAKGADILIHEVTDLDWAQNQFRPPLTAAQLAKLDHWKKSHTSLQEVGEIAQEAEVKMLVLSHMGPSDKSNGVLLGQIRGFKGQLVMGAPMMEIALPSLSLSLASVN
jgi:ribonuclease BN (tRNA processing enzyme)